MSFIQHISVLILTYNEAANIGRTLEALRPFPEIVLLDSGSTDETLSIACGFPNVRVATRPFDNHAAQWNHGLSACGLSRAWVLALDADYVVPPPLLAEIDALEPRSGLMGYRVQFRYAVFGKLLSGSLYPPVTVLHRRGFAHFVQDGHTQRAVVDGPVESLRECAIHDDRKSLARWLASQDAYARLEADLLLATPWASLRWQDRLRLLLVVTPWLVPIYCLIAKRGILDGWPGVYYALQRGVAETILSLKLMQSRFPA